MEHVIKQEEEKQMGGTESMICYKCLLIMLFNTIVGSESDRLVVSFIEAIRAIPWLNAVPLVYICESNTGQESSRHYEVIHKMFRVIPIRENNERHGVWTSPQKKSQYGAYARAVLDRDALFWLEGFACVSPDPKARREELRIMAIEQMSRACVVAAASANDLNPIKIGWSGKKNGQNDDLVMALSIAQYFTYNIPFRNVIPYIDYTQIYGT
jgi:hypothetical protein